MYCFRRKKVDCSLYISGRAKILQVATLNIQMLGIYSRCVTLLSTRQYDDTHINTIPTKVERLVAVALYVSGIFNELYTVSFID